MRAALVGKLLSVFSLLFLAAGTAHGYTLLGDSIGIERRIPSVGFVAGPFTTTVISGTSDSTSVSTGDNMYVNPEATSIIIELGPTYGLGGEWPDHQIRIFDLDWIGEPGAYLGSASAT